jgi:ribonuclease BN (tRNA processing enzyme)
MRLTVIGTGTAAPHPRRVQTGVLIECDAVRLLIDCGSGVVFRMAQLNLDWRTLTHVAVTHFHADHCSDLPTLVFGWRYGMLPARSAPVDVMGPVGTHALLGRLDGLFHLPLTGSTPQLRITELVPREPADLGHGVAIEACKVPHTAESVAYAVTWRGRRAVFSGDTGFDAEFGEWAAGADLLLLECSLPESLAIPMHLTPEQCGVLAGLASPGLLVLTHLYPPVEDVDIAGAVRAHYAGPLVIASDGWSQQVEPVAAESGTRTP